ncbi:MAG: hypothetical protein COY39_03345 [Alphaproteobacteria bacterium CG_4_10_14_0_8_um_filter_37_21]|nr:MAG: hypothetical protein COY39_03345 [Alphaproteobacteria bacterium CG_4_10_14_0_8_um_filter_37_21]
MTNTISDLGVSPSATRLSQFTQSQLAARKDSISDEVEKMGRGGMLSKRENPLQILRSEIIQTALLDSSRTVKEDLAVKIKDKSDFVNRFTAQLSEFKSLIADARTHQQLPNGNFTVTIQSMLKTLENDLNKTASLAGTGELYNNKVADFSLFSTPASPATVDTSYALGGETGSYLCIDVFCSTTDISALTAKDPMIEETVRAMRLAIAGNPSDPADQNFSDALDLINSAEIKSIKVKESIAQQTKLIENSLKEMEKAKETEQERYEQTFLIALPNSQAELQTLEAQLDLITNFRVQEHLQLQELNRATQRILG